MSHYLSGIIKIMLLEAQAGLLIFDRFVPEKLQRAKRFVFIALAALMVFAWSNYLGLRGNGVQLIHPWEQFHFYLGAKYQAEVGWFDLYRAAVVADSETVNVLRTKEIRNNATFEMEPTSVALNDAARIKAKFGPRWEDFKADWVKMATRWPGFDRILQDHGNSNSPAWSVIAHPITRIFSINDFNQTLMGLLDMVLMGIMFWQLFKTFGLRVGCVSLFVWASPPLVFDYLSGSLLRWDWLFALGMSVVFMKKERWKTAGAFFGYAVATKLFPLFFGVALLFRALILTQKEKKPPKRYVHFFGSSLAAFFALFLVSSAMFGGTWVWKEYKERIDAARVEKFYAIQYSLQTVYLQAAASTPGEYLSTWFFPAEVKQARPDVDVKDYSSGFFLAKLLFTFLVLLMLLRADDIQAFTLGPLLVFTWLIVNMYYWNMLGLLALGLATRKEGPPLGALAGLSGVFMIFYAYQHTNHGMTEGYITAVFLCLWMMVFAAFEYRAMRGRLSEFLGLKAPGSNVPRSPESAAR